MAQSTDFTNFSTERPNYFPGQYLLEDDFELQHKYLSDRQRYNNQILHIYGIVEGLEIEFIINSNPNSVLVKTGSAINSSGDLIVLKKNLTFSDFKSLTNGELYIQYSQDKQLPQQTDVADSYTRWQEKAIVGFANTTPANCVKLAKLTITATAINLDLNIREYSGLSLPNSNSKPLTLRSGGNANSNLAVLTGSLKIDGDLTVSGTGTSAFAGNLNVTGTFQSSDGAITNVLVIGDIPPTGNVSGYRTWMTKGIKLSWNTDNLFIGLKDEGANRKDAVIAWGDDPQDDLRFINVLDGGDAQGNELLRIKSNGNVGIGTTSPQGFNVDLPEANRAVNVPGVSLAGGTKGNASIELRNNGTGTPFIDFSQSTKNDFDARIRLTEPSKLAIEGANLSINLPGGMDGWNKFVVNTTSEWGDGTTQYVTIGAGGASGIMLSNPHITWRDTRASIRYGRSGGIQTGSYWDAGVRANESFSFSLNGVSDNKLTIAKNGNVSIQGAIQPSAGSTENNGIMFPKDPGGGSGDAAWIRYYSRNPDSTDPALKEQTTLEIGILNDPQDHIALMPSGSVGIGTNNPTRGKLHIEGSVAYGNPSGYRFLRRDGVFDNPAVYNAPYSLYASSFIGAQEFNAFSDLRIKEIKGNSDSQADLQTLLQIQVTDYSYKDKIAHGDSPRKKVIGQQIAAVYPQAVSTHADTVPDILQFAVIAENWVTLNNHNLNIGDKVKIFWDDHKTELFPVEAIKADSFKISLNYAGDVFVYGREVDDFHVVDYDALSMLHISATQELYKIIKKLEADIIGKIKVQNPISDFS